MKLRPVGLLTAFTAGIFQSRRAFTSTKKWIPGSGSAWGNQNSVAFAIAKRVALSDSKGSNLVLSPLSIHSVLSLVAAGSEGATRDQLLSFLRFKTPSDVNAFASELVPLVFADGSPAGGPRLSFANAIWHEKTLPLKPSFKEIVETGSKAAVHPADFLFKAAEVPHVVNSWIKKETDGLIPAVLPPGSVDCLARLIFANALYFKGVWAEKFDASEVGDDDFHLLNGGTIQLPFMTSKKKQLIGAFNGFKVLELPYTRGGDERAFSMYMFLPDAKDGLPALIDKASSDSTFIDRHLPRERVRVGDFRIPRFKISCTLEASEVLKELGLELPFAEGGLTQMVDSAMGQDLRVGPIYHTSFIDVNEECTKAATASVFVVNTTSCMGVDDDTDFVADHPFMFVIRENTTGLVLFIGHVLNPSLGCLKSTPMFA